MSSEATEKLEIDNLPLYKISLDTLLKADMPVMSILDLSALNAPIQNAMFGKDFRFDSRMIRYRQWMFEDGLMKGKSMGNQSGNQEIWTKAVTDAGEIVGAAVWVFRLNEEVSKKLVNDAVDAEIEKNSKGGKDDGRPPIPDTWNMQALQEWGGWCHKAIEKAMSDKDCLKLNLMLVHPSWQRRGIGKLLMQEGLKIADEKRWNTYLCATTSGYPFYKQMGFEDVEGIDWDVEKWRPGVLPSGSKSERTFIMVRRPNPSGDGDKSLL